MTALAVGFGLGFLVAAQVGPVSLLAIRSTLRGGLVVGLAMGLGVAVVDALYAAAGAAGAGALLEIDPLRTAFGLVGAAVLVAIGARTLYSALRVRSGLEADDEVTTPAEALRTALAATASNPLTIASWAAIFAAASTAAAAASFGGTLLLVIGVGAGSLAWMVVLAATVTAVRHRLGPRVQHAIDALAGLGILAFGGLLAARTVRDG